MQKKNLGKEFELRIKNSLNKPELNFDIERLPDPLGGYMGMRNICDFTGYKYPFKYYLECKSKYGNTLNFKGDITEDQWEGLTEKSKIYGILAGICVWFIDYDRTLFVSIQELNRLRFELNKKSLNIKDVYENTLDKQMYFDIEGKKKKTYFNYDTSYFINSLETLVKHIWIDNEDSDING